ncbi:SLBB domain-containing protein, partial [Patescibacteria group bacterium]|nr:SLBB domain-containing protein [Patescibacteria group bacterium]
MLPEIDFGELFFKFRFQILLFLTGAILIGLGALLLNTNRSVSSPKVEVLETSSESKRAGFEIVVEVVGAVQKPGVYELTSDARVEDALIAAGGISAEADRAWMEKTLNRAARLVDGQKIYIPEVEESRQEGSVGEY